MCKLQKFSGKLRLAGYKDGRKMDYHPVRLLLGE